MIKKYAATIHDPANTLKSKLTNAMVSFKNTRETSRVLINRSLANALKYLKDVTNHKQCVPMKRYARGVGRTAQAKAFKTTKGRWPKKSCDFFIGMIENLKTNAKNKNLDENEIIISSIVVNKAPIVQGRLHRAHGRINPYNKKPCHIQIVAVKRGASVPKQIAEERVKEIV